MKKAERFLGKLSAILHIIYADEFIVGVSKKGQEACLFALATRPFYHRMLRTIQREIKGKTLTFGVSWLQSEAESRRN